MIDYAKFEGHTPGPWFLMDENNTIQISDSPAHGNRNAVVHWTGFDSGDKPLSEKRANARLIAAVPKLLAANRALQAEVDRLNSKIGAALIATTEAPTKHVLARIGSILTGTEPQQGGQT